jgi:hypothetical protein
MRIAENFAMSDKLLLPILNKQFYNAHAHYTLLEMLEFSSCHSYQYDSVVPAPIITPPPTRGGGSSCGRWSALVTVIVLIIPISCGLIGVVLPCSTERIHVKILTNPSRYHLTQAMHPTSHLPGLPQLTSLIPVAEV